MNLAAALLMGSFAVLSLAGCDKVRGISGKLKDVKEAKTRSGVVPAAPLEGAVVRELGEGDYEKFIATPGRLSVVVFHADWCGPCKQLAPVVDKVAQEFSGVAQVGRFDVDKCPKLAAKMGVRSIPDVRFFLNGEQADDFIGGAPELLVREKFSQHVAGLVPAAAVAPAPAAPGSDEIPGGKDWMPPGMKRAGSENKVQRPGGTNSKPAKGNDRPPG